MKSVIKKRGKSASIRIPAAILQAARLDLDHSLKVREEAGRIVIEPPQSKRLYVAALITGITRKNLHDETDFVAPV
jgi:antitoxin MazE